MYKNVFNEVDPARLILDSSGKIDLNLISVTDIIANQFNTVSFGNQIYILKEGIFRPDKGEINASIVDLINKLSYNFPKTRVSSYLNEIKVRLLAKNLFVDYPFNRNTDLIPVENGVISIDNSSGQIDLLDHDPANLYTYYIPMKYDPTANPTFIQSVFNDWMGDDAWILVQIVAQCILQSQTKVFKKSYMILGRKDAGKSTYLDLLGKFFGENLISRVDFQKLTGNTFALSQLEGKLINLADDQPAFRLQETATFKRLTGGCMHNVEAKYRNPYVAFVNPVYIFAANDLPKLPKGEDLNPFLERFEIVPFERKFSVNPRFAENLANPENMSALLNLVLIEINRINQYGIRSIQRDESNQELWVLQGNSLYRNFVNEYFVKDSEVYLEKDVWYETYLEYCKEMCQDPLDYPVFFRKLIEIGITDTRITRLGERIRIIKGWNLKSDMAGLSN